MLKTLFRVLILLWGSFCLLLALRAFAVESPVLVYIASEGQSNDIFAYDVFSHLRFNLSKSPYPEWSIDWSASNVLAYTASANQNEADALFLSRDYASPARLQSLRNQMIVGMSLSPNGESLLYFTSEPANYSEIYGVDLHSEIATNISNTPSMTESAPQWLDNETVLFLREGDLYQSSENALIHLLLDAPFSIEDYAISPDGRIIALQGVEVGASRLYLMQSDGRALRHIVLPLALSNDSLSWSPDSQSLAFTLADGSLRVYQHGEVLSFSGEGRRISPSWSPDGRYIAFMEARHLYLLDWTNGAVFSLDEKQQIRPPFFWMPS